VSIQERIKVVEVVALNADPPVIVDQSASIREAVERMREARSGCALVTAQDKLVGILTERDLLSKGFGEDGLLDRPVTTLMAADPATVHEHDPILKAVRLMRRGGFRNVPVVDGEGRVVACVRHKDMIRYLVERFADRTLLLPPDPDQILKTQDGA
jgi:CBS domain-containing protein